MPFVLLLLLSLSSSIAHADASHVEVRELKETRLLLGSEYLEILEDLGGELTVSDIIGSERFKPVENYFQSFGFTSSAYWLRVRLHNSSSDEQKIIFHLLNPFYDEVSIYQLRNNSEQVASWFLGDHLPYVARPVKLNAYAVPMLVAADQTDIVYVRLKNSELFWVALAIDTPIHFLEAQTRDYSIHGFIYGIIVIMILYNLILFLMTMDATYGLYCLYLTTHSLFLASIKSLGFEVLWGDYPGWNAISFNVLGQLLIVFMFAFISSYFDTKNRLPSIHKYLLGMMLFAGSMVPVVALLEPRLASPFLSSQILLVLLLVVWIGLSAQRKEIAFSKIFNLAFMCMIMSYVAQGLLATFPLLWSLEVTDLIMSFGLEVGVALEATLLSIGVGYRMSVFRSEAELLQKKNLRFHEQARENLEREVTRKTEELTRTLDSLKKSQSMIAHQARTTTMANLVGGMAHELGNPLTLTVGGAERLSEIMREILKDGAAESADLEEAKMYSDLVLRGSDRIEEIVLALNKLVSSGTGDDQGTCEINEVFKATLGLMEEHLASPELGVEIDLPDEVWVKGSAGGLAQVFMNVLMNSVQAMGTRGVISISHLADNQYVSIRISDTGPGIAADIRDKVFDAFFTTKKQGEGTGLGLSISHQIIAEMGGLMILESTDDGTCFRVSLVECAAPG